MPVDEIAMSGRPPARKGSVDHLFVRYALLQQGLWNSLNKDPDAR